MLLFLPFFESVSHSLCLRCWISYSTWRTNMNILLSCTYLLTIKSASNCRKKSIYCLKNKATSICVHAIRNAYQFGKIVVFYMHFLIISFKTLFSGKCHFGGIFTAQLNSVRCRYNSKTYIPP